MPGLDDPIDSKESIKSLWEQVNELKQKQKEDEKERKKALQEQIKAIILKQKEEEEEHKRSLREEIAFKMDMARSIAREEHIKKHHPGRRRKQFEFLQDQDDVEVRKGFLKLHILNILKKQPSHGYELIHMISHHTDHLWTPSPGSMYPALESLESKGYITCQGDGRRKVYSLTPKGENVIGQVQKKHQEQFMEMKTFLSNIFDE